MREPQPVQALTDRAEVIRYMRSATPVFDVLEDVRDLFDETVVVPSGPSLMSDGRWIWRVDSIHYLSRYSLSIPEEFLHHVREAGYRPPASLPSTDEFEAAVLAYF
ncbi:hypothetical protein [Nocardia takedensis]|uniref:hypothetical protein n=1 Tax=Nocardia takedensis TaxID=259390 RepID=UPI0012F69DA8|nr:hypothetical protein [Nocardia takedensis]